VEHSFWFVVTASFVCPNCSQNSTEKVVLNHPTTEFSELSQKIEDQVFCCQNCKEKVPEGTQVSIEMSRPWTRESLKSLSVDLPPEK